MFHPSRDPNGKIQINTRLEPFQSARFYEFVTDLAESKCRLIVAEERPSNSAQHDIGEARSITVAPLETEIDRSAYDQGTQVPVRKNSGRHDLGENVESSERPGVAHQRRFGDILDLAAAEPRPDPLVFAPHFVFRRMR